jgi:hypothetical protein
LLKRLLRILQRLGFRRAIVFSGTPQILGTLPYPFFQIVNTRVRTAIVVFGAISTIEITAVCHVKAALRRSLVRKPLAGLQNVVAGEFATDFVENPSCG